MQKKHLLLIVIIVICALAVVGRIFPRNIQQAPLAENLSPPPPIVVPTSTAPSATPSSTLATSTLGFKTYRNDQWGFEFQYPDGWEIKENTFGNPSSKFNLVAHAIGTHPDFEPVIINVVTTEFVNREYHDIRQQAIPLFVDNIAGLKYVHQENVLYTDIIIPLNIDTSIIIGNENTADLAEYDQVLASFKFLK